MLQIQRLKIDAEWSPRIIARGDFVAILAADGNLRPGVAYASQVLVHSGAVKTIAGEMIDAPISRPVTSAEHI